MFSEKDNIVKTKRSFMDKIEDRPCKKCKIGVMKRANMVIASDPHKYTFKCNNCENLEFYTLPQLLDDNFEENK